MQILDFEYMERLVERPLTLKEKRQAIKIQKRIDKYKRQLQEEYFNHPRPPSNRDDRR